MRPLRHQALAVRRLLVQGSLDVPRPHTVLVRRCRLRRLLCVAAFNITASYASAAHRCAPPGRIRGRYVLRPSGKCRRTSQGQRPSLSVRGSKTGLVMRRPFAFCCAVGCAIFLTAEVHFIVRGNVTAQA